VSVGWWVVELLAVFGIVLLHEAGHAIAGHYRGTPVGEIVLWPLGGLAIGAERHRWKDELVVASGGPAVNLVLVLPLFGLWYWVGYRHGGDVNEVLWSVAWENVGMLVFNLLPIWPLDGGRLMQSALWGRIGAARSRWWSGMVGIVCACCGMMVFARVHSELGLAMLAALLLACVASVQWGGALLRAERCWGLNRLVMCPVCGSHPIDGPTGACARCGYGNNVFDRRGGCWNCGEVEQRATCRYCGVSSDLGLWYGVAGGVEG
jgi:Zn-dependent protease